MTQKYRNILLLCSLGLLAHQAAFAQGTFRNLDFEDARIIPIIGSPYFPNAVATSNALPGWSAYIGGNLEGVIHYDDLSLGAAWISIHDTNGLITVLQGRYTIDLEPSSGGAVSAAIGQVGIVPSLAQSLRFYGVGEFSVSFRGQALPLMTLANTPNGTLYGSDITAFPGQLGELRFQGGGWLDNIFFSPDPVPEPNALALFGVGVLFLFRRRRGETLRHGSR